MAVKVSNEDFVVAYATSQTLDDMVKTSGMTKPAVQARKKFLMQKGVKFPKLSNTQLIDDLAVARMNSLIKKHDIKRA